jgi:hypothetical protein
MTERTGQLPPADDELWSLVEAFVADTATAEERDRLETRLRAETAARLFYVAYLDLHAHLQWRMRGEAPYPAGTRQARTGTPGPLTELDSFSSPAVSIDRRPRRSFAALARPAVAALLTLAAAVLVAVLVQRRGSEEEELPDFPDAPPESVAVLIDNNNTVWEKDMALPTRTGSALPPGRVKLRAGVVEIAFRAGGEVLLEGPADFDVSAPDRGYLHRGKLTAKVPKGAPALRVSTPGVVVTDHGGECGVFIGEAGGTEVHVFAGHIGADPTDPQGGPVPGTRLLENAGIRVDAAHGTMTPVPLNAPAFARLRPVVRFTDATVRAGQFASRNFGTRPRLIVKNSIPDYTSEAYLCFDLSGIKGNLSKASVRLVPVRVGEPTVNAAAFVADNLWSETSITWDSKPLSGAAFATWTAEDGKPVEFDVTGLVREALAGDRLLSLRIFAPHFKRGKGYVEYGSRKGEAASRPQLVVTMAP